MCQRQVRMRLQVPELASMRRELQEAELHVPHWVTSSVSCLGWGTAAAEGVAGQGPLLSPAAVLEGHVAVCLSCPLTK